MSNLILYINSRNWLSGSDSDFLYFFKELNNPFVNYTKVSLLSISIPKEYYLININTFFLNEGDNKIKLSMPIGNYNTLSFTSTLSFILTSNSQNGFVYSVKSDITSQLFRPTTGKFTYII